MHKLYKLTEHRKAIMLAALQDYYPVRVKTTTLVRQLKMNSRQLKATALQLEKDHPKIKIKHQEGFDRSWDYVLIKN